MKKRAKIITTIASLCLAVALMAFGVYAATQVTFNVTTKVSFEVEDVFITINAAAHKDASGDTTGATQLDAMAAWKSYTPGEEAGDPNVPGATVGGAATPAPSWTMAANTYKLDSVNKYVVYVITVSNDDCHAIQIAAKATPTWASSNMTRDGFTIAASTASDANNNVIVQPTVSEGVETGTINKVPVGTTVTFTYVAHITNLATDVSNFTVLFEFRIAQEGKALPASA